MFSVNSCGPVIDILDKSNTLKDGKLWLNLHDIVATWSRFTFFFTVTCSMFLGITIFYFHLRSNNGSRISNERGYHCAA